MFYSSLLQQFTIAPNGSWSFGMQEKATLTAVYILSLT